MTKKPYPSDTQDRFIVRLPDGMRDEIARLAKQSNRSMNAEIVARLEDTLADPSPVGTMKSIAAIMSGIHDVVEAGSRIGMAIRVTVTKREDVDLFPEAPPSTSDATPREAEAPPKRGDKKK